MDCTLKVLRKTKETDFLKFRKKTSDSYSSAQSHINKEVEMISMNIVNKNLKKGLAAAMLAAMVSAVPAKADVVAGGAVPLINSFVAVPNQGIDIQGTKVLGSAGHLASIIISNNAPNSFSLVVTLTNGGFLQQGLAAGAGAAGTYNAFTGAQLYTNGRTPLADAVQGFVNVAAAVAFTGFVATSTGTFAPGAQTAATSDYTVDVEAGWSATTTLLAGFYSEKLVVSLVALM